MPHRPVYVVVDGMGALIGLALSHDGAKKVANDHAGVALEWQPANAAGSIWTKRGQMNQHREQVVYVFFLMPVMD